MNATQRKVVAATLAVAGALCLWKAWVKIYVPSQEFLGLRTTSSIQWSETPMGWVLAGVAAFGIAVLVWMGGRGEE